MLLLFPVKESRPNQGNDLVVPDCHDHKCNQSCVTTDLHLDRHWTTLDRPKITNFNTRRVSIIAASNNWFVGTLSLRGRGSPVPKSFLLHKNTHIFRQKLLHFEDQVAQRICGKGSWNLASLNKKYNFCNGIGNKLPCFDISNRSSYSDDATIFTYPTFSVFTQPIEIFTHPCTIGPHKILKISTTWLMKYRISISQRWHKSESDTREWHLREHYIRGSASTSLFFSFQCRV